MILHIDTKDQKQIKVSLKDNGKIVKSLREENKFGSQVLLPLIIKLLRSYKQITKLGLEGLQAQEYQNVNWKMLKGVEVEKGQGSFTGIRVGVAVANALGWSLNIPVNGKRIETKLKY